MIRTGIIFPNIFHLSPRFKPSSLLETPKVRRFSAPDFAIMMIELVIPIISAGSWSTQPNGAKSHKTPIKKFY